MKIRFSSSWRMIGLGTQFQFGLVSFSENYGELGGKLSPQFLHSKDLIQINLPAHENASFSCKLPENICLSEMGVKPGIYLGTGYHVIRPICDSSCKCLDCTNISDCKWLTTGSQVKRS